MVRRRATRAAAGDYVRSTMSAEVPARPAFRRRLVVLALVVFAISAFFAGGHSYAIDNEVQFQTTRSLLNGSAELESYSEYWVTQDAGPYRTTDDGGVVGVVPIGQSLLSVPLYAAGRAGAQIVAAAERDQFVRTATFFTNSVLLALTAVVVALLARELMSRDGVALLLGYVYAFGTYAFANAQTYFTEIGASLFVALACWLAIRMWTRDRWDLAAGCGLAAGMAFMVRPSAGLFLPVIGLCLVTTTWVRREVVRAVVTGVWFSAGAVAVMAVNSLFAWWRFGSPTDLGYETVYQNYPILSGLTGQVWSLGKGVLWYAPVVALSAVGAVVLARRRTPEVVLLVTVAAANTLFFARVPFWSGDAAWGPRYTLIILPVVVPLAIGILRWPWGLRSIQVVGVAGLLLGALPGTMVNFGVLFIEVGREVDPAAQGAAIRNELAWQPILGHLELAPDALRDALGADRPGELQRQDFTGDPDSDWGFYGIEPRLDVWWAWIGPTRASPLTWVFLLPTLASLGVALWIYRQPARERNGQLERPRSRTS